MRKTNSAIGILAAILVVASARTASAAPAVFVGEDVVATTTSAHPNSATAAAAFDAAVAGAGGGSLVTFESAPLGSFSSLSIAPGVTLSGTDYVGNPQTIRNTSNFPTAPTLDGFNTTPGGAAFVELQGGTLTVSFATPIQAFGAYFSGIQTNFFADKITFSDGTSQTLSFPGTGTTSGMGALDFVGFTDAGQSITSVTVQAGTMSTGADFIGLDDLRFQSTAGAVAVAEPATIGLLAMAFAVLGLLSRRRPG